MTRQEYRASLQPAVDAGKLTAEVADMLAEDYADLAYDFTAEDEPGE
jgi:hypothetical protein